jgi:hypothetical protein
MAKIAREGPDGWRMAFAHSHSDQSAASSPDQNRTSARKWQTEESVVVTHDIGRINLDGPRRREAAGSHKCGNHETESANTEFNRSLASKEDENDQIDRYWTRLNSRKFGGSNDTGADTSAG